MTTATQESRDIHFLGNNEITVLVSGDEANGAFCVLDLRIQPRGGATMLHTDQWVEVFHLLEGEVEWTLERDGELVTWNAHPGETVRVPIGARHRFAGAGTTPSRMLLVGDPQLEDFFRALAAAWEGPYDREQTPQAVAPVFERFGMRPSAA